MQCTERSLRTAVARTAFHSDQPYARQRLPGPIVMSCSCLTTVTSDQACMLPCVNLWSGFAFTVSNARNSVSLFSGELVNFLPPYVRF